MRTTTTFYETFKKAIQDKLPSSYEVRFDTIAKNNGTIRPALIVRKKSSTVGVTTYIEFYEEQYASGVSIDELADKYLETYRSEIMETTLSIDDLSFLNDKNTILSKVFYRIVNRSRNELFLENAPWSEVIEGSDIVMTYSILVTSDEVGFGTVAITNALLESLGLEFEAIKASALENTPKLLPYTFMSLGQVLGDVTGIFDCDSIPLFILSNESNRFGSSSIAYEGVLEHISDILGGSFFILPSSIHETLVLRDDGSVDASSLRDMVECVNLSSVEEDELLSFELYYFDANTHILSVA